MPKNIVVLIREDPQKSHKPSEGMRIALGLSTGPNPLQIILLGKAKALISDDAFELPDGEMLEKYLPAIQSLKIPIFFPNDPQDHFSFDPEFTLQETTHQELANMIEGADRVLAF